MSEPAVLITRPAAQAAETARRVSALGWRPVVAPLLEIRRLDPALPNDTAAVLLTSANAVPGLPAWARARPVLAVGSATAARARAAGCANVTSAGTNAVALAALVRRLLPPGASLLLLAARGEGIDLATGLTAEGWPVIRHEVYEAVAAPTLPEPARAALMDGDLAAALFFSARTARHFVALATTEGFAGTVQHTEACAIGPAAGMALQTLPWRRIRLAAHPTQDAMLALLQ